MRQMTTNAQIRIGGDLVDGELGSYEIINPATEEVVGLAPQASVQQNLDATAAAAEAFGSWSQTKPEYRAELLNKAADLWDAKSKELVPIVQAETGATVRTVKMMQYSQVSARLRRYARAALDPTITPIEPVIMPTTPLAPGGIISAAVNRAPVGVVSCLASYNVPGTNMAGKIAPALAMGNTVVMKPAPQDPLGVFALAETLIEAGFPPGVVNVTTGTDIAASEALVSSRHVDMVSFTGSTGVGRRIGEVAGGDMKRLLLELGGKGACIVYDDADLKAAIGGIASVWGFHSGQICTSPTRVIVQRGVYEKLVGGLTAAAQHMKVGDPLDKETVVGPVITAAHRERVMGYIQSARDEGATIAVGGDSPQVETGFYVNPTLITDATAQMTAVREEIFGPVVAVVPFDDDDEAIAIANDSDFGLYSYIFSSDTGRAFNVAKRLRSGNVGINSLQRNHEAPFGGFKQSGVGRDGGVYGMYAYSEMQSIVWPG
ncbi:MAG: aldehyde dehydrogenase family protein [Microthrixaceae bacterium]|nr:aldehyde dehydrogenase family protein [Microthrixaceae bacterium]